MSNTRKKSYWNWVGANHGGEEVREANPDMAAAPEKPEVPEAAEALMEWVNNYGPEVQLTEFQRQVFTLCFMQELSIRDAATQLGASRMKVQRTQEEIRKIIVKAVPLVNGLYKSGTK